MVAETSLPIAWGNYIYANTELSRDMEHYFVGDRLDVMIKRLVNELCLWTEHRYLQEGYCVD